MSGVIQRRVKKVLTEKIIKGVDSNEINYDTPLIELGIGVDSVATLELIVALEQEFKMSIDENDVNPELLESINSISCYISRLLS
jgi:acyl carrier protein